MEASATKRIGIEKAQNFMRQYRDPESRELKKLSAGQFMEVWAHYDKDGIYFLFFLIIHIRPPTSCILPTFLYVVSVFIMMSLVVSLHDNIMDGSWDVFLSLVILFFFLFIFISLQVLYINF